jgi:putative SOS response-associated peptidase YedK
MKEARQRPFPRGRCLVPVSHFYEFTGKHSPKDKWRFTKVDGDWFCIAGLWRPVEGQAPAFTMLTCEPSPDVAPIHNRQIVVLGSELINFSGPTIRYRFVLGNN